MSSPSVKNQDCYLLLSSFLVQQGQTGITWTWYRKSGLPNLPWIKERTWDLQPGMSWADWDKLRAGAEC